MKGVGSFKYQIMFLGLFRSCRFDLCWFITPIMATKVTCPIILLQGDMPHYTAPGWHTITLIQGDLPYYADPGWHAPLYWSRVTRPLYWSRVTCPLYWSRVTRPLYWSRVTCPLYWSRVTCPLYWSRVTCPLYWSRVTCPLYWSRVTCPLHWSRVACPLHWSRATCPITLIQGGISYYDTDPGWHALLHWSMVIMMSYKFCQFIMNRKKIPT